MRVKPARKFRAQSAFLVPIYSSSPSHAWMNATGHNQSLMLENALEQFFNDLVGEQVGLKPKLRQSSMDRVVVMLFRFPTRVLDMLDGHIEPHVHSDTANAISKFIHAERFRKLVENPKF